MKDSDLKTLIGIVQKTVLRRQDVSVEELADRLGKRASTLYNEINPNHTGTAKLGVRDLVRIMAMHKDVTPLEYMASLLGCILTPVPSLLKDEECREPTPENFSAMLDEARHRLAMLEEAVRAAGNGSQAGNEECLDILLACQACHQALGEVFRSAQLGATRNQDKN